MDEQKNKVQCTYCKCYKFEECFINEKGGLFKMCLRCREIKRRNAEKNKCPHGRRKETCKECGGSGICIHNRMKATCKDCNGSSICIHNRIKAICKDCNGSSICIHGRIKYECKECGGSRICIHGRDKYKCKECNGSSICIHNKIRSYCKECMNDEQKIEFIKKRMIQNSRDNDKKYNRYDANNFIDLCFLNGLFEDTTTCHYCSVDFTYNERCNTLVTIERLNNNIGHTKSNCVLACWECNMKHKDKTDVRE